jgi:hypothetical protein
MSPACTDDGETVAVGSEGAEAGGLRWHICAVRRFGGETVENVLARYFGQQPRRADEPVTDDEYRWMERVVTAARSVHREFLAVADAPLVGAHSPHIQLLDSDASVSLDVGPDAASIVPLADYAGDAAGGFALMWQVCQALTRDAECIIVDPTAFAVIEMQLDADRAREEYGWI